MHKTFIGSFQQFRDVFPHIKIATLQKYDAVCVMGTDYTHIPSVMPDEDRKPETGDKSILIIIPQGTIVVCEYIIQTLRAYAVCDIIVEQDAQLHIYIDFKNTQAIDKVIMRWYMYQNSSVSCFASFISAASSACEINYEFNMRGQGSKAVLKGIYCLNSDQNLMVNTRQHHDAHHTESDISLKGAIASKAQVTYNGTIILEKEAEFAHANQQNKNILFGSQARAIALPSLEVHNHNVQCKHGSATGYFDEIQLLYLQSRGIDAHMAKQMLLVGFFQEMIDGISQSVIRAHILKGIMDYSEGIIL